MTMTTTITKARGISKNEYNALIHAIWRLDVAISEETEPEVLKILSRDRAAITDIFIRIS
jgi:hypothetical protein